MAPELLNWLDEPAKLLVPDPGADADPNVGSKSVGAPGTPARSAPACGADPDEASEPCAAPGALATPASPGFAVLSTGAGEGSGVGVAVGVEVVVTGDAFS